MRGQQMTQYKVDVNVEATKTMQFEVEAESPTEAAEKAEELAIEVTCDPDWLAGAELQIEADYPG